MATDTYLAFVLVTAALMLVPGPNVALIAANAIAHGRRIGLLTVAGTSAAMVIQLGLTALGMASVLGALGASFEWLRWLGVGYLVYLGIRAWTERPRADDPIEDRSGSAGTVLMRGFLVSLTNPKTLFFYGAFFPQFIARELPVGPQLALLSATFIGLAIVIDGGWALLAARLSAVLRSRAVIRSRIGGTVYIVAALGLAAARRPA